MSRGANPRGANPYRAELPDGTRIERAYRVEGEGEDAVRVPRGNWQWVVYDPDRRPKRKRVNLRTRDKGAAMRRALDHARDRALGAYDPWDDAAPNAVTVERAVEVYAAAQRRAGRAESTVSVAESTLSTFVGSLPAGCRVDHVDAGHVEAFVTAPKRNRKGEVVGPKAVGTRRRYRAVLRHFFGFCRREGFTRSDPTAELAAPSGTVNRRDHLTEAEAEAMVRALDAAEVLDGQAYGWIRDWIWFGLGTGLRPGEQRGLRWRDVRLDERTVRVRGTKTAGSVRPVRVAGRALATLRRLADERAGEGGGPVFAGPAGGGVNVARLTKRLKKLATSARVPKTITAYSLRHGYGTRMAAAGVPLLDLARIMGTSVAMIERHYGHYCPERGGSHVDRVFGLNEVPAELAEGGEGDA